MEKKKMTNKKKFWIGMSSLAAIGVITATVAYFYTDHTFKTDTIESPDYRVTATKLLDAEAAKSMYDGKTLDADVTIKNEGSVPVLAKITYYWKDLAGGNSEAVELADLADMGWNFNLDSTNGEKFLYDSGSYYYAGTLGKDDNVKHLDSIEYKNKVETVKKIYYKAGENESGTAFENEIPSEDADKVVKEEYSYIAGSSGGELTVKVETIQATDAKGDLLDVPSNVESATLIGYWNNLGKGTTQIN